MEISKKDWKLFREKLAEWQENYMERLNKEYITLLSADDKNALRAAINKVGDPQDQATLLALFG